MKINQTNPNQPNRTANSQAPDPKKKLDARRRGITFRFRVANSLPTIRRQPWMISFIALPCAAFIICWLARDWLISLIPFDFSTLTGVMPQVLTYAIYAFIILLFALLLALVLQTLGTPRKARKIDKGLINLFRHDAGHGDWPIYISCRQEAGSDLFTHTFFSEFVPLEIWRGKQETGKLTSLLGGHIDTIHYGGKDEDDTDYIIVVSGNRAKPKERPATSDPLFEKGVMP